MRVNFFGPDPAYHEARQRFVFKGNPPTCLAVESTSSNRRDPMSKISREVELAARAGTRQANACYQVETQSARLMEEDRRSVSMAQAWVNLLREAIRRLYATA